MAETTVPPPPFDGFPAAAFTWFAGLEADNSQTYFSAHRAIYDQTVRGALEVMLEELAGELGGRVRMFRQHRDVRFSAEKSPYKTTTYGLIVDRPAGRPALYAQLSVRGLFAGGGYHQMAADQLSRFRAAVADDTAGPALEQAIARAQDAGIETFGASLKTAPRGYARDHPRVRLLRHKALVAGGRVEPGPAGIDRDAALGLARSTWAACAPLDAWLEEHVGPSQAPPARGRYGA